MDHPLPPSDILAGRKARLFEREGFTVAGFTRLVRESGDEEAFLEELRSAGLTQALAAASPRPLPLLVLGSWDPEVGEAGTDHRCTVCIEEVQGSDFSSLPPGALWRKWIAPSLWLELDDWTWDQEPYPLMEALGFQLNMGGYDTGLHFDVYPAGQIPPYGPFKLHITVAAMDERGGPSQDSPSHAG